MDWDKLPLLLIEAGIADQEQAAKLAELIDREREGEWGKMARDPETGRPRPF